jgi:signal transduction histidine kinase
MDSAPPARGQALELPISLAVILALVVYTYGILAAAPYSGFYFNPATGRIEIVFANGGALRQGDIVAQIGEITLDQFRADRRLVLYQGTKERDVVEIVVERNGERVVVAWVFPGFTPVEFTNRLFNTWLAAYAFWLAGFSAYLTIRPRDARRRLFIAANYLLALFLVSGTLSSWHLWESSTLLHIVAWLMVPVFLQFHWVFPRPLGAVLKIPWSLLYGAATLLAAGEAMHLLGRNLYAIGFITAVLGSFALLTVRLVVQKEERQTALLLVISTLFAFSFSIASAIAIAFGAVFDLGPLTFFSMPFMPLAYFYLIYRRQLGGMESRVNRFVSLYAFLILLGVALILLVIPFMRNPPSPESWAFLMAGIAFAASIAAVFALPRFRSFVDQRFFGIKLPYQRLPETYSRRIAVSVSLPRLLELLDKEVFPSLLIRQYAFLQANEKRLSLLLSKDVPEDSFDFDDLAHRAGTYLPSLSPQADWLRLIIPLQVGDSTLGFWLLGKRDPDDHYPQAEIPILQSLADQTAIALSSILRAEQLRSLYQTDIERAEHERKSLSRDLHDSVLNQLAAMRNSLDDTTLPPGFLTAYEELKHRIREIIANLRPPMLDQGLAFALTEYAEDIREKNGGVNITLNLQAGEERLPENMETHLFHIVREACENALRHANARTITITGEVSPQNVDLSIQDDGIGFDPQTEFNALLAANHFGLANMKERAHLIGADLTIRSRKGQGTTIRVTWQGEKTS